MRHPVFPGSRTTWSALTAFFLVWVLTYVVLKLTGKTTLSYGSIILSGLVGTIGMLLMAFVRFRLRPRP